MIVTKILNVINHCNKLNTTIDNVITGYFGKLNILKGNINIVYILNNTIYIGYGYIRLDNEEYNRALRNHDFSNIIYTYAPKFIGVLTNSENEKFIKLLKYEQKKYQNIKISTSYSEWIQNDIVSHLEYLNQESYYTYEVDSIDFHNFKNQKEVEVCVCFDNHDIEQFHHYYIPEYSETIKHDLLKIGEYNGEIQKENRYIHNTLIGIKE